jgi:hypothetical protein
LSIILVAALVAGVIKFFLIFIGEKILEMGLRNEEIDFLEKFK